MKKRVIAILAGLMTAIMVTGCGSEPEPVADYSEDDFEEYEEEATEEPQEEAPVLDGQYTLVLRSNQSPYWQAVINGANDAAAKAGVGINVLVSDDENDTAAQSALISEAAGSGAKGIGVYVGDESAVSAAVEGALAAQISVAVASAGTEAEGALAAQKLYPKVAPITERMGQIRIGVITDDLSNQANTARGMGFINEFISLAKEEEKTVAVIGAEQFVNSVTENNAEKEADILIESIQVMNNAGSEDAEAAVEDAAYAFLLQSDVMGLFTTSVYATENVITANDRVGILGSEPETTILGIGYGQSLPLREAVEGGRIFGAITPAPYLTGTSLVEKISQSDGTKTEVVDQTFVWYDIDNIGSAEITRNFYE